MTSSISMLYFESMLSNLKKFWQLLLKKVISICLNFFSFLTFVVFGGGLLDINFGACLYYLGIDHHFEHFVAFDWPLYVIDSTYLLAYSTNIHVYHDLKFHSNICHFCIQLKVYCISSYKPTKSFQNCANLKSYKHEA